MAMISGGDESAKNAFRAYLRDDSSQLSIGSTEELSPGDVLEVKNLASAIERAERVMRESSRPRDMFADLGSELTPLPVPTDDASGPAVYAKPVFTPVPPPLAKPTLLPALPKVGATQPLPILLIPNEEDAFLQPAGRMRHFADETLDGYRPDSTMQIRAGARRKTASIVVGALIGALVVILGAGVVMANMPAKFEAKPTVITSNAAPAKKAEAPAAKTESVPSVPTMNVNDLPSAR